MTNKELEKQLEIYKKALEYYADEKNYEYEYGIDGWVNRDKGIPIQKDNGKIARNALFNE